MELKNNYDEKNALSIEAYSKELIGKTFEDVLLDYFTDKETLFLEAREKFNNPYQKGSLGNLIEEYFFGYLPNSSPEPDFPKAGVELKVTPYETTKKGKVRAGERLVLGMIPNNKPVPFVFEESSAYSMLNLILLVLYYRDKDLERVQHPIHYSQLVSLNSEALKNDLEIIKSDYRIIINKVTSGRAHELSEADTMYLGASTKGGTAKKSYQPQYYNPNVRSKRRAFSLKQSYMSFFINTYILDNRQTYDVISDETLSKESFEQTVIKKLISYKGSSREDLSKKFGLVGSNSKSIYSELTLKILNVNTENAEEFEKSNTQVKTIRLKENGIPKESMSFPAINFLTFAKEEWEESDVYTFFSQTRFLFVIFQEIGGEYYLDDAFFWNMPMEDLEKEGRKDWLDIQKIVRDGVNFRVSGSRVFNSLPNESKTKIFHLRPKADNAAYHLKSSGYIKGNLEKDADALPNGDWMTRQCFWLNKNYLIEQINNY